MYHYLQLPVDFIPTEITMRRRKKVHCSAAIKQLKEAICFFLHFFSFALLKVSDGFYHE